MASSDGLLEGRIVQDLEDTMIRTVEIKRIEDAMELILDRQYNPDIRRMRTNYIYRGIPDTSYRLVTSLRRNCGDLEAQLEMPILRSFTKFASIQDESLSESVWRQMIAGQHYGLPTRLLDWTHSSLIAMHFATSENNIEDTDKRDGIVWRIDLRELSEMLPDRYREVLVGNHSYIFTEKMLCDIVDSTEGYDRDMAGSSMVILEPPSMDQRIINQYSFFSVVPMGMGGIEEFLEKNTDNTVKYIINKNVRWDIRDLLDQFNISERVVYPGLDGLSKWIARHYYVIRDTED